MALSVTTYNRTGILGIKQMMISFSVLSWLGLWYVCALDIHQSIGVNGKSHHRLTKNRNLEQANDYDEGTSSQRRTKCGDSTGDNIKLGDLNIGSVISLHHAIDITTCGKANYTQRVKLAEAIKFAVENINRRTDILNNVTLGYVILDDCTSTTMALARALQFMPREMRERGIRRTKNNIASRTDVKQEPLVCNPVSTSGSTSKTNVSTTLDDTVSASTITPAAYLTASVSPPISLPNTTSVPVSRKDRDITIATDSNQKGFNQREEFFTEYYDVIGVVGADTTKLSLAVASILTLFQIPQVSPTSTSDVLSNKKLYPNFMRVVPADRYQVEAISVVLEYFNWSHVSVIFTDSSYGREGVKRLKSVLGQKGICISKTLEIGYERSAEDMRKTMSTLRGPKSPKVVVLYIEIVDVELILRSVKAMGIEQEFIWVASDSFSLGLPYDLQHMAVGSLTVRPYSELVEEFEQECDKRMNRKFPSTDKTAFGLHPPVNSSINDEFNMYVPAGFYIDAVNALATGADLLIKERCPGATGEELRKCVKPVTLCQHMRNLTFNGSYGEISFDQNGDVVGMYEIIQYQVGRNGQVEYVSVGSWDMRTNHLEIENKKLLWPVPGSHRNFSQTPPVSTCGAPCPAGSIYYYTKETCCWECRKCKENEITAGNFSSCQMCPIFYWPVDERQNNCEKIAPHFSQFGDKTAIIACSVASFGSFGCIAIVMIFFQYRNDRPIRASSRELSQLMLLGISVAYLLVFSFMATPSDVVCYINYVGFNLSFTLVYAPLLVKTIRIHRIFKSGRKSVNLPPCTSSCSQLVIAGTLISIQVVLLLIVTITSPPAVKLGMPVLTEKFVEMYCYMSPEGLILPLSFNLILVMICAYYAFRSRKLPDNFNESRYIAFCVDTTLLIWLSFLPTYFITSRAYHKVLVMSSALIINATVNLICLFLTKLCALYKYRSEYRKNLLQEQELFRVIRSIASDNLDLHSANQKRVGPSGGVTGSVGVPLAQSQSCNNLQQQSLDVTLNTVPLCKSDSNLKAT